MIITTFIGMAMWIAAGIGANFLFGYCLYEFVFKKIF